MSDDVISVCEVNNSSLTNTLAREKAISVISRSIFMGREIDVYGSAENPLFLAKDVATWIEYDTTSINKLVNLVDDDEKVRKNVPTLGGNQEMWMLTEDGLYEVLMQSRKPIAKQFKKGVKQILKEIRKTGSYSTNRQATVEEVIVWVKGLKDLFNLNDTSVASLINKAAIPNGLPALDYVQSKGVLHSASELLKKNGLTISVQAFNLLAIEKGFLKDNTRISSHGKEKHFKTITEKGLEFGENQICPKNPNSTQPLWYDDKFLKLVDLLGLKV